MRYFHFWLFFMTSYSFWQTRIRPLSPSWPPTSSHTHIVVVVDTPKLPRNTLRQTNGPTHVVKFTQLFRLPLHSSVSTLEMLWKACFELGPLDYPDLFIRRRLAQRWTHRISTLFRCTHIRTHTHRFICLTSTGSSCPFAASFHYLMAVWLPFLRLQVFVSFGVPTFISSRFRFADSFIHSRPSRCNSTVNSNGHFPSNFNWPDLCACLSFSFLLSLPLSLSLSFLCFALFSNSPLSLDPAGSARFLFTRHFGPVFGLPFSRRPRQSPLISLFFVAFRFGRDRLTCAHHSGRSHVELWRPTQAGQSLSRFHSIIIYRIHYCIFWALFFAARHHFTLQNIIIPFFFFLFFFLCTRITIGIHFKLQNNILCSFVYINQIKNQFRCIRIREYQTTHHHNHHHYLPFFKELHGTDTRFGWFIDFN